MSPGDAPPADGLNHVRPAGRPVESRRLSQSMVTPRLTSIVPCARSAARTEATVARDAPASAPSCSWVIRISSSPLPRIDASELEEPPQDATPGVFVERLAQQLVHSLQLPGEEGYEYPVNARMSGAELVEIDSMQDRASRPPRGPSPWLTLSAGDERELAERLTAAVDREKRVLADRGAPRDSEAAVDDEVERICRIVLVKNDFAAPEGASARDGEHTVQVVWRHPVEELPLHAVILGGDVCD